MGGRKSVKREVGREEGERGLGVVEEEGVEEEMGVTHLVSVGLVASSCGCGEGKAREEVGEEAWRGEKGEGRESEALEGEVTPTLNASRTICSMLFFLLEGSGRVEGGVETEEEEVGREGREALSPVRCRGESFNTGGGGKEEEKETEEAVTERVREVGECCRDADLELFALALTLPPSPGVAGLERVRRFSASLLSSPTLTTVERLYSVWEIVDSSSSVSSNTTGTGAEEREDGCEVKAEAGEGEKGAGEEEAGREEEREEDGGEGTLTPRSRPLPLILNPPSPPPSRSRSPAPNARFTMPNNSGGLSENDGVSVSDTAEEEGVSCLLSPPLPRCPRSRACCVVVSK